MVMGILLFFIGVAFLAAWRGYLKFAGFFAPLVSFGLVLYLSFDNYGLRDTALLALPVVIVAGSILNGKRGALFFGMLSLLGLIALFVAEQLALIPGPVNLQNRPSDYIIAGLIIILLVLLQFGVISRFQQLVAAIRAELEERQRTETALRKSETLYAAVINQAQDGVVIVDGRNVIFVSPSMISMLGHEDDTSLVGSHYLNFIVPEQRGLVASISAARLRGEAAPGLYETQLLHQDGRILDVEISAGLIDYNGQPASLSVVRDITARKKTELILKESVERFFRIFHDSPDPMVISRMVDGTIIDANASFEETFGFDPGETIGQRTIEDLKMYPNVDDRQTMVKQIEEHGELRDFEVLLRCKNGTLVTANASARRIMIDDMPCLIYTARDVTERKAAEAAMTRMNVELEKRVQERTDQLERANRELESFSYSVSHDLRAPLRAINGFSRILADDYGDRLDVDGRALLGKVQDASRRMDELINNLLSFSRLSSQAIIPQPVKTHEMVVQIVEEARIQLSGRSIQWVVSELPDCQGDPGLLRQVFSNLVENAVKYTRNRTPAIIEIGAEEQDETTIFFVRDNGVGFDMKYADKLFGVFQRLHSEAAFEGTGIGLATVRRIINRHGGAIWVQAQVDHGATFFFTL